MLTGIRNRWMTAAAIALALAAVLAAVPAGAAAVIDTLAGGLEGSVPAASSRLFGTNGIAVTPSGDILFADPDANRVRKLAGGMVSTFAGNGTGMYFGDGRPATEAALSRPKDVAVDTLGNIYIADYDNGLVRWVTPAGVISTLVSGYKPTSVAVDQAGNVLFTHTYQSNYALWVSELYRVGASGFPVRIAGNGWPDSSGDGGPAINAKLNKPDDLVVDPAGNIYIADCYNNKVRRIDTNGIIATVAGGGSPADGLGDGLPATQAALTQPHGLALDGEGNLYIADATGSSRVRKVNVGGIISTFAGGGALTGDGNPADASMLSNVTQLAIDGAGNLLIGTGSSIRKVAAGIITTLVGSGTIYQQPIGPLADDGIPAMRSQLNFGGMDVYGGSIALDDTGNVFIADTADFRIRKVDPAGIITWISGGGFGWTGSPSPPQMMKFGQPQGVGVDSLGRVYISPAAHPSTTNAIWRWDPLTQWSERVASCSYGCIDPGDGYPASEACVCSPYNVVFDGSDNTGCWYFPERNRVRKVDAGGIISTVAGAGTRTPAEADGGPAADAALSGPTAIAFDGLGNLYIADTGNNRIRKVTGGIISTVAGGGSNGLGDGLQATQATLFAPQGVAIDGEGNLYIADSGHNRIRKVDSSTHVIHTLAGTGVAGFDGDHGPPEQALLNYPRSVAVDGAGNVYFTEQFSDRVRWINYGNPVAEAGGPYLTEPGGAVALNASGSSHPDPDAVLTYSWDAGSLGTFSGKTPPPFNAPSTPVTEPVFYPVTLTVTDQDLRSSSDQTTIRVYPDPKASITISPAVVFYGDTVTFTGSNADNIVSWTWTSNKNGPIGDKPVVSTAALLVETHTITYQIRDNVGRTSTATKSLVVRPQSERTDLAVEWGDISFWKNGQPVTNPDLREAVTVRAVVHNLSPTATGTVSASFFDIYEPARTEIGTVSIPSIPAWGTGIAEIAWTNSPGVNQEGYHVIEVDLAKDAFETYLDNNSATHMIMVGRTPPAGSISVAVHVPASLTVYQGSRFTVSGSAAYVWPTGYTLPLMGGTTGLVFMGGQSWTTSTNDFGNFSLELTAPETAADYVLRVTTSDSVVSGTADIAVHVVPLPGPDLTVYSTALGNAVATEGDTIFAHIANVGGYAVEETFIAAVEVRDPAGALVYSGEKSVPGMAAASSLTLDFGPWTPQQSGNYRITVTVDRDKAVRDEQYETNNVLSSLVYVYPHRVDFEVVEIVRACNSISATIRNIGGSASTAVGTLRFSDASGQIGNLVTLPVVQGKGNTARVYCTVPYGKTGAQTITASVVSSEDPTPPDNNSRSTSLTFGQKDISVGDIWVNGAQTPHNNIVTLAASSTLNVLLRNAGCVGTAGTLEFYVDGQPLAVNPVSVTLGTQAEQSVTVPFTFLNPPYPAGADYTLTARVAVSGDTVPSNNMITESLWIYPSAPDYKVDTISFSYDPLLRHPSQGEQILISAKVCNVGQQAGQSFQIGFYEEGRQQIGVVRTITPAGGLAPGACTTDPIHPWNASNGDQTWGTGFSGNHVILVSVAPQAGGDNDPNDSNNQKTEKVWINHPPKALATIAGTRPDYSPKELVPFSGAGSDDSLDVDNLGGVNWYDWSFSDAGTGSVSAVQFTKSFAAPGTYYGDLTVRDTNNVPSAASSRAAVVVRWSDLQPTAVSGSVSGPNLSVSVTVKNNAGGGSVGASKTGIWFSLDTTLNTASDFSIGDIPIPWLATGATSPTQPATLLAIPLTVPAGKYYVIAQADRPNEIGESLETNNTKATTKTLIWTPPVPPSPKPDLVVLSGGSIAPTSGKAGSAATVVSTVMNQGTAAAGSSYCTIWFSLDSSFGGTDLKATPNTAAVSLAVGAPALQTTNITVPSRASAGKTYHVGVCADAGGTVTESNETNNCIEVGTVAVIR